MSELSYLWTDSTGDGGPYSQDQWRTLQKALAGAFSVNQGVIRSVMNGLRVTSTGNNNVTVATGAGIVDGTVYVNDVALAINTASPAVGTTGRRVVLRKLYSSQTVRAVVISSADGTATIPALTQSAGTQWEIPLAQFTITTGGVLAGLADERVMNYALGSGGDAVGSLMDSMRDRRAILADYEAVATPTSTLVVGGLILFASSGTGTLVAGRNGRVRLATTNAGTGSNSIIRNPAAYAQPDQNPRFIVRWIPAAANAAIAQQLAGLCSDHASATPDGAYLRSTTTGNLFFVTRQGGAETTTDLGVAPAANTLYEIYTTDGGSTWVCMAAGVVVAVHTANVPTASTALYVGVGIESNTTTDVVADVDHVFCDQDR